MLKLAYEDNAMQQIEVILELEKREHIIKI